jgi:hypothetical protein
MCSNDCRLTRPAGINELLSHRWQPPQGTKKDQALEHLGEMGTAAEIQLEGNLGKRVAMTVW